MGVSGFEGLGCRGLAFEVLVGSSGVNLGSCGVLTWFIMLVCFFVKYGFIVFVRLELGVSWFCFTGFSHYIIVAFSHGFCLFVYGLCRLQ